MTLRTGAPAASGEARRARLDAAVAGREAPLAVLDLSALEANRRTVLARAGAKPVRLATKSIRCRSVLERLQASSSRLAGVMAFTLPEALWLAEAGQNDVLVAYPSADRTALGRLAAAARWRDAITLMVDSTEQLDLLATAADGAALRVCIDIDAGYALPGGRIVVGAKRSPVRSPAQARTLAIEVVRRGLVLDGVMAYESQIAGVADRPPGKPLFGAAIREVAPLRFVNGGGSGSLESTSAEDAVTEVTSGSAFYGPALFDGYSRFRPQPAAAFALPVVRRPRDDTVTVLGGGYIASGAAGTDRLPRPWLPAGLRLDPQEGAGEVQTPLRGRPTGSLRVGDLVWFRHAKAGELCEHFNALHLVNGDTVTEVVPTYRGEGRAFL